MRHFIYFIYILVSGQILFAQNVGMTGDSTINRCESKTYTLFVMNNSGNDMNNFNITLNLSGLPGFSYVDGSAFLDINGGGAFCNQNPFVSGDELIWNVDLMCGSRTLSYGDSLNLTFNLATDCTAVSGFLNFQVDYLLAGNPGSLNDSLDIKVFPGAVSIKKTPVYIPQEIGQDVTWTITIENTGEGIIENVEVTDELGAGLSYVSSTQNGMNSGQNTSWTSTEYAALASMNPGDRLTMDITATVIGGQNLDNKADVKFGCDPATACFDTASAGGTAFASVQRIIKTPILSFNPPDINFDYCEDFVDVSFFIDNNGDGTVFDVWIWADFMHLYVTNVSVGAVYNTAEKRFELTEPIPSGGRYTLSFRLNNSTWCTNNFENKILWQPVYRDNTGIDYYSPINVSTLTRPSESPSLSTSISGLPESIQVGQNGINGAINTNFTGVVACGSASAGDIDIVLNVPSGFVVIDAGGGVWIPGGDGFGGTIEWTVSPLGSPSLNFILDAPSTTLCETYCNTLASFSVQAQCIDCCGCVLSASDSLISAIECEELVDSEKSAVPVSGERCTSVQYTNTYIFSNSVSAGLTDLVFTDYLDNNQSYIPGSISVVLSGVGDITASVMPVSADETLIVDFSGASSVTLTDRTLVITYQLMLENDSGTSCLNESFYSWSSLDMGVSGSECLTDGIIHESVKVDISTPQMSVAFSGMGTIFHECESKSVTMTITQNSAVSPHDVKVVLSGTNYSIVNPGAVVCSGVVSPVACTPMIVGSDYVWTFDDGFSSQGDNATLQFDIVKKCGGTGDLTGYAYFDNNCTDDSVPDESCFAEGTTCPDILLIGDLVVENTPEVIYTESNSASWEIYLTNRGSGTAYNVWLDAQLGSGLTFNSTVVDDMTGVTISQNMDHQGGALNGCTVFFTEMAAGERRQITLTGNLVSCNNLTLETTSSWGCAGVDCQTEVTDTSIVDIPLPNVSADCAVTPQNIDSCSNMTGIITVKNSGQANCYNVQVTENLPAHCFYISGTTRWKINGGGWNGPNIVYDPNSLSTPLVWDSSKIPPLAGLNPGDILEIECEFSTDCQFSGGEISCIAQFENPCGQVFLSELSTFNILFREPQISVDVTRVDDPVGCNELIQWTINVANTSGYTLPVIWVECVMDSAFTYQSSMGDPPYTSDNGTNVGQMITYELRNVNHNDTITLTLNATTDSVPCSPDLDLTVNAYWGCGSPDGSSFTKPGVDAPDDILCLNPDPITDIRTETREPGLAYLSIGMSPVSIDSCNDSTQLTVVIENIGPTDASHVDLIITLPDGLVYNTGTSRSGLGPDNTVNTPTVPDPNISSNTLTYYDEFDKAVNLADIIRASGGDDTLVLKFNVTSSCYVTDEIQFELKFFDCCDDKKYSIGSQQTLTANYPSLSVTNTANLSQVQCGSNVRYTVTVTNNGTGNAEVVRVEDVLGDWLDYAGNFTENLPGTVTPAVIVGNPQTIGWEFNNLLSGATATFSFDATLNPDGFPNQNDCTATLRQNNVSAILGCGTTGDAVDDNPNTSGYDCISSSSTNASPVGLNMPDLAVTSITPSVTTLSDSNFSGTVSVRVLNNGDGISGAPFTVQVTDGKGWTGSGVCNVSLNTSESTDVTINTSGWTPACHPCDAPYLFNATADINNDVCECNENNNTTTSATSYSVTAPDLVIFSDTLYLVQTGDGQVSVNGNVTLVNNGCNDSVTGNIPVRLTLYNNTGCSGGVVTQWTDIFSSANIPAGGGTQTFTISSHFVTSDMVLNSTGCQVSIMVEADYNDTVSECDGTNNNYCGDNKTINCPDIEVNSDTLQINCQDDGQIRLSGTLTLINNGCGSNLTSNVPMRFTLYDNTGCGGNILEQWTQTFSSVNISAGGGTQVFTITPQSVLSDMVLHSTGCQVSVGVEADYTNSVYESDGSDNIYCADNKSIDVPDIFISNESITVTYTDDNEVVVTGNITCENNGCGANLVSDIPVRITMFDTDNCTGNQLELWTETLGAVNIPAKGGTQVLTLTEHTFNADLCSQSTSCNFSIQIESDYTDSICESNGENNSLCVSKQVNRPDLKVSSIDSDIISGTGGAIEGYVTVNIENTGCSDVTGVVVRLSSDCGLVFQDKTTDIAAGSNKDVVFDFTPEQGNCICSYTAVVDPDNSIVECDGTNNSMTAIDTIDAVFELSEGGSGLVSGDLFDFGEINLGNHVDAVFTVSNTGTDNLVLEIPLTVSGTDESDFSLISQPSSQISPSSSTQFTVRFSPLGGGIKQGVITIQNSDCSNTPFILNLKGTCSPVVSGMVTDGTNPIAGVDLSFSHDTGTTPSDASGNFSYDVDYNTTTTITPSHVGYHGWTPSEITLSNITADIAGQNFTGVINTYTISGMVTDGTNPIAGVTISFSHDSGTTTTDSNGVYSYIVDYNTTTTITPSHPGYHGWTPLEITLNNVSADTPDQNFTGVINTYTISGMVTDGTNPIAGVTMSFSHDSGTTTTDGNGVYSYVMDYNTTTTITPSHPGYHGWTPLEITLNNVSADTPDQNFSGIVNTYTISGMVTNESNPIAGVTMSFSHDSGTTMTDGSGLYSYVVDYNTTTTITPSHPGFHGWTPREIILNNVSTDTPDQNFSGIINTYTISGIVTDGTNPIEGVNITFSHNGTFELTDSNGHYSTDLDYGTSSEIIPEDTRFETFIPGTVDLNVTEDVTADFLGTWKVFKITATCNDYGRLNPYGVNDVVYGHNLTIKIVPDDNYFLDILEVDGELKTPASFFTFRNVTDTHTLYAEFKLDEKPVIESFYAVPEEGHVPLEVEFVVNASDPDGGNIIEFQWDFNSDGFIDVTTQEPTVVHKYYMTGTYYALVTVVDNEGSSVLSDPIEIEVTEPAPVSLYINVPQDNKDDINADIENWLINVTGYTASIDLFGKNAEGQDTEQLSFDIKPGEKLKVDRSLIVNKDTETVILKSNKLIRVVNDITIGNGHMCTSLPVPLKTRLYVPHIAEEIDEWNTLGIVSDIVMRPLNVVISDSIEQTENKHFIIYDLEKSTPDNVPSKYSWGYFDIEFPGPFGTLDLLSGYEVFLRDGGDGAAVELPVKGSKKIYIPHIPVETLMFWTGFAFVNPSDEIADVSVILFSKEGEVLDIISLTLTEHSKEKYTGDSLFPEVSGVAEWGYIESTIPIMAVELYGSQVEAALCGFGLPYSPVKSAVIPFVKVDDETWTGLSVTNPNIETVQVKIFLMSQSGQKKHNYTIEIEPFSKFKSDVVNIFSEDKIAYGDYLLIESDQGILTVGVFGNNTFSWMKAIGGID